MEFTFTQADAQVVYGLIVSVCIPFLVSLLSRPTTSPNVKFGLAIAFSVLGGVLSQYVAGALNGGSFVVAAVGVFTASQAHFASWFSGLGIDNFLLNLGIGPTTE